MTQAQPRPITHRPDAAPSLVERLAESAQLVRTAADDVHGWLTERAEDNAFRVAPVALDDLAGWGFADGSGDMVHDSGGYFSVVGVDVRTDYGAVPAWSQPMLDQPERAILGILARESDGVLQFLMQAKMEPGNVNLIQLSPTVQATPSNYRRTHQGAGTRFLEYFTDLGDNRIVVDCLQSEQGSWFRGKRNRNMVVETAGPVAAHPDYAWLTLGEILQMLQRPNVVNMDARTVLSCLPAYGVRAEEAARASGWPEDALRSFIRARSWLTDRKTSYSLETMRIPLNRVAGWHSRDGEMRHVDGKYFRIIGVDVAASSREVRAWQQPLLAPVGRGLAALVMRRARGVPQVLMRADLRAGYRDVMELGPTVQCTPGNFVDQPAERRPQLLDLVQSAEVKVRYDVDQSEEGGRFYQAVTRYLIVEVDGDDPVVSPDDPDFRWMTLPEVHGLVKESYQVNIEARSLLLCAETLG